MCDMTDFVAKVNHRARELEAKLGRKLTRDEIGHLLEAAKLGIQWEPAR